MKDESQKYYIANMNVMPGLLFPNSDPPLLMSQNGGYCAHFGVLTNGDTPVKFDKLSEAWDRIGSINAEWKRDHPDGPGEGEAMPILVVVRYTDNQMRKVLSSQKRYLNENKVYFRELYEKFQLGDNDVDLPTTRVDPLKWWGSEERMAESMKRGA